MKVKSQEMIDEGLYAPERVVKREIDGKAFPCYRDSFYSETEQGWEVKRKMLVGKQVILVRSVFPADASKTPTQKLLCVIDSDLNKNVI